MTIRSRWVVKNVPLWETNKSIQEILVQKVHMILPGLRLLIQIINKAKKWTCQNYCGNLDISLVFYFINGKLPSLTKSIRSQRIARVSLQITLNFLDHLRWTILPIFPLFFISMFLELSMDNKFYPISKRIQLLMLTDKCTKIFL